MHAGVINKGNLLGVYILWALFSVGQYRPSMLEKGVNVGLMCNGVYVEFIQIQNHNYHLKIFRSEWTQFAVCFII